MLDPSHLRPHLPHRGYHPDISPLFSLLHPTVLSSRLSWNQHYVFDGSLVALFLAVSSTSSPCLIRYPYQATSSHPTISTQQHSRWSSELSSVRVASPLLSPEECHLPRQNRPPSTTVEYTRHETFRGPRTDLQAVTDALFNYCLFPPPPVMGSSSLFFTKASTIYHSNTRQLWRTFPRQHFAGFRVHDAVGQRSSERNLQTSFDDILQIWATPSDYSIYFAAFVLA